MKKRPPQASPAVAAAPDPHGLSAKQRAFVEQYLVDGNGRRAAESAGYSGDTAESQASRLLRNVKVKAALDAARGERRERLQLDGDRILLELSYIGHLDPAQLMDADGKWLPLHKMPEGIRRAIASIEVDAKGTLKVRFWDKPRALELLGKSKDLQLFSDKVQHEAGSSLADLVLASMGQGTAK